ncbi:hypothetical protein NL676_032862 [Syzygium grande]|nr:hypothetical protein NL676_032862 [Syzygium grande]
MERRRKKQNRWREGVGGNNVIGEEGKEEVLGVGEGGDWGSGDSKNEGSKLKVKTRYVVSIQYAFFLSISHVTLFPLAVSREDGRGGGPNERNKRRRSSLDDRGVGPPTTTPTFATSSSVFCFEFDSFVASHHIVTKRKAGALKLPLGAA